MTDKKHSGLGIASFVLSIAAIVLVLIFFITANFVDIYVFENITEENIPTEAVVLGLIYLLLIFDLFVALILGFVGLFSKDKKITFSIAGLALSVFISIFLVVMTIIGSSL
ncbi:MAG: hypothetical protein LBG21_07240 [Campylobacteraceae bacterium]|jgi:hypothetical protein|nr:hypothetical protein [Campylobacteraceae bacterium]